MSSGLFVLGLPEATLKVVQEISKKTGKSYADVIAEAIQILYRKCIETEKQ